MKIANRMRLGLATALLAACLAPCAAQAADVKAVIETNMGNIELLLDEAKAPVTVANFVNYAKKGHYDGTIFHRVIPGFMIQGGGFEPGMKQRRTDAPIVNEARNGLQNRRGTIAMARTSDPHSATSQFFINTETNDFLDARRAQDGWGYAVFGQVSAGMDVVDKISGVKTGRVGYYGDVPLRDVVIKKVTVTR